MHWLTLTHTQRWHAHYGEVGSGHLYQGRFKSFPVQGDEHFLTVCCYVERNALRAGLVQRAEEWRWGSLGRRRVAESRPRLSAEPVAWPADWLAEVNRPQTEAELEALRRSVERGQPYGGEVWMKRTAGRLGLLSTLRARGILDELQFSCPFFPACAFAVSRRINYNYIQSSELLFGVSYYRPWHFLAWALASSDT